MKDFIYDDWYKHVDSSEGIYIGLGVSDQSILKINSYSKELNEKLPNNYGYYISEGLYNIIKLI